MMNIAVLTFLSLVVLQAKAVCIHNTRCEAARGIIQQTASEVSLAEKVITRHRWWNIDPTQSRGVIMLAFKNVYITGAEILRVRIIKRDGQQDTRIFSGKMGNFELVSVNVQNIIINATLSLGQNTNFTLQYYSDCEIAQENPILYPDPTIGEHHQATCFIIVPFIKGYTNRIYYTVRDIALPEGIQMNMMDVHSSKVIAMVDDNKENINVAVESTATNEGINSFLALIDLTCSAASCDYSRVRYLASYYAMHEQDIWCIEVQRLCAHNIPNIPEELCDTPCPGLEAMSEQEYILESGYLTTRVGSISTEVEQPRSGSSKKRRRRKCPNWANFPAWRCNCARDRRTDVFYCHSSVKCPAQGGCTWRCILTKILRCITVKRFVSVTLL